MLYIDSFIHRMSLYFATRVVKMIERFVRYYYLRQGLGVCNEVGLSVCVQPHEKSYAWIYMKLLPKVGPGSISR